MQLTETRFTTVHETTVSVAVNSADEARHALKELRHLKKELRHQRRRLAPALKAAEVRERRSTRGRPARLFESFAEYVALSMSSVASALAGSQSQTRPAKLPQTASALRAEIQRIDKLNRHIDSTALQIEGRLIAKA